MKHFILKTPIVKSTIQDADVFKINKATEFFSLEELSEDVGSAVADMIARSDNVGAVKIYTGEYRYDGEAYLLEITRTK